MFSAIFGHAPLYRSRKRKTGRLFTPAVAVSFAVLLILIFTCFFASVLAPYYPNA